MKNVKKDYTNKFCYEQINRVDLYEKLLSDGFEEIGCPLTFEGKKVCIAKKGGVSYGITFLEDDNYSSVAFNKGRYDILV